MRKFLLMAIALAPICSAFAQNSAIYRADEKINDGKLQEAAQIIEPALTSGKTKNLAGAYNIAGITYAKMLQAEIAKAASKQPLDTNLFISSLDKAVKYFEQSYKLDNQPDEKGKVKPKLEANAEAPFQNNYKMLGDMISYYRYAGQFLYNRGDHKGAYEKFARYLDLPKDPIFTKQQSDSIYKSAAEDYYQIAYFTTMLGYQMKDDDLAMKYIDFALQDTAKTNKHDLFLIKAQTCLNKKDTATWLKTVKEAIQELPDESQYVQNLLYYYNVKHLNDEAVATAQDLVAKAGNNKNAWYSAGCIYLNMSKDYTKAREYLQKALDIDPNFADANYNMGVSYVNELISKKDQFVTDPRKPQYKTDVEKVKEYYRKALVYFEKTRELAPNQPQIWGLSLKNIYYNLQMKDKEKEIDKVLADSGIVVPDASDYGKTVNVKKTVQ
jgi:tetratricopeptide (TPR) repeat protein